MNDLLQNLVGRPVMDWAARPIGKISAVWENNRGCAVFLAIRRFGERTRDYLLPACIGEFSLAREWIRLRVGSEWVEIGPSCPSGAEFTDEMKFAAWNFYHLNNAHRFDAVEKNAAGEKPWQRLVARCDDPHESMQNFEWSFLVKFAPARMEF